jgi:hypothetical protein
LDFYADQNPDKKASGLLTTSLFETSNNVRHLIVPMEQLAPRRQSVAIVFGAPNMCDAFTFARLMAEAKK